MPVSRLLVPYMRLQLEQLVASPSLLLPSVKRKRKRSFFLATASCQTRRQIRPFFKHFARTSESESLSRPADCSVDCYPWHASVLVSST